MKKLQAKKKGGKILLLVSPALKAEGITNREIVRQMADFIEEEPSLRKAFEAYLKEGTAMEMARFLSEEVRTADFRLSYTFLRGLDLVVLFAFKDGEDGRPIEVPFSELSREERDKLGLGDGPQSSDDED